MCRGNRISRAFLKLLVGCFFFSGLFWSCSRDSDPVIVDFEKTVPLKRPVPPRQSSPSLRVAVGAMVSPKETVVYYRQLVEFLGKKMNTPVELVQRKTYHEINQLLGRGEIDLGFICSGPYAGGKEEFGFQVLVVPQIHGEHFYRSYLIVNKKQPYQRLEDLRGHVFAFTDPDSNTGRLAPSFWLYQRGEKPEQFFSKVIYTYSHDNSILAVSRGLVDGAAVDGLVWEYFQNTNPAFTKPTRVILKSEPYAIPPVVASREFPQEKRNQIRQILLTFHLEAEGRQILSKLMIDRFITPPDDWFESTKKIRKRSVMLKEKDHGSKNP